MLRVALLSVTALAACGRIGFDGHTEHAADDGGVTSSSDGAPSGGDDASGGAGTFGTMQVGISTQNSGTDRVWISRFALAEPAQVSLLVAHLGSGSQATPLRGLIYSDAAGTPSALLGTTLEMTLDAAAAPGWVALPFAAPVALAAGRYWLGTHSETQVSLQYMSGTGATKFTMDLYSDGADTTYTGAAQTFTMQLSIYAGYTR